MRTYALLLNICVTTGRTMQESLDLIEGQPFGLQHKPSVDGVYQVPCCLDKSVLDYPQLQGHLVTDPPPWAAGLNVNAVTHVQAIALAQIPEFVPEVM